MGGALPKERLDSVAMHVASSHVKQDLKQKFWHPTHAIRVLSEYVVQVSTRAKSILHDLAEVQDLKAEKWNPAALESAQNDGGAPDASEPELEDDTMQKPKHESLSGLNAKPHKQKRSMPARSQSIMVLSHTAPGSPLGSPTRSSFS